MKKYRIATGTAILFHVVGLVGILFVNRAFFLRLTPFNLLLMLILLLWTQSGKNRWFYFFFGTCSLIGLIAEIVGVQTGLLFGQYRYGEVMGYGIGGVPWILGVNWFIVIYCCGTILYRMKPVVKGPTPSGPAKTVLPILVLGGALLATLYDGFMEPVAIKLGYWSWLGEDNVPWYNYVCWFLLSTLLLTIFYTAKFEKGNKFAVNLMLIQGLFFLLLRVALN
jgi:bisanhydrobacterioruberin hydratase